MTDRSSLRMFILVLLLVGVVLLYPRYRAYRSLQKPVPPGVTLDGMDFRGVSDVETVKKAVWERLAEPISLRYGTHRIILRPSEIRFRVDVDRMLAKAQQANTGWRYWANFVLYLAGTAPLHTDIPPVVSWDPTLLGDWMLKISQRYDRPSQPPRGDSARMVFLPGREGTRLNMEKSAEGILAALENPYQREGELVVEKAPVPAVSSGDLAALLGHASAKFPGIVSVYTQDLKDGMEAGYHENVAFAAMSTIKVPIGLMVVRKLSLPLPQQVQSLMENMLGKSGNKSSNELLSLVGDGDARKGCDVVTGYLKGLGLDSTYIAAPYFSEPPRKEIPTPANHDKKLDTHPDPAMQTTAAEMGRFLAEVARCAEGNGKLLSDPSLSVRKCQRLLEFMSLEEENRLIPAGLPPGTKVIHKHGFIKDSYGDVAVVWGPGGEFVLSIYIYHPPEIPWNLGSVTIQRLARGVWNYYALKYGKPQSPWEG